MAAVAPPLNFRPPRRFANAAEWLAALGGVPLDRIIFDPWPGTATEADLLRLVEHDDRLCELVDGTLIEKPMGYWEGLIAANLIMYLGAFVRDHDLGAVFGADSTMRMKSGRVRMPDVAFVSKARLPRTPEPIPPLGPDLAVEVLSEGNTAREMEQKLVEYFQSGTRLAWLISSRPRSVAVYTSADGPAALLDEHARLEGGDVLGGFSMAVADLFGNVPKFD